MKFAGPALYGGVAAVTTYLSTLWPGTTGALLLVIALFLWVLFIVYIIRAVRPE